MSGAPVPTFDVALPRPLAQHAVTADGRTSAEVVIALFDAHAPALLRYVRSLGLDAASAEDVLQDTFVALHRHLLRDRSRANLIGWLFQVAQNLSRREHRRRRRGLRLTSWAEAPASRLINPNPSPAEAFEHAETTRRTRLALQALPIRDQHCLRLRAEGLRYRDIAQALGISLGSVAKSVARALAHLATVDKETR